MEWCREPDWWYMHAVDAHMRSRFSERWETQCWLNLLLWQAGEPLDWQVVDWASNVSRNEPFARVLGG